jgi:hypothetical protein
VEWIAPMAAAAAAIKNSEQAIRRQPRHSGVNLEAGREFVIIGLSVD